ncbi:MAG: hypothetical protein NT015_08295 [Alphaproteobacteria bacterium]|nr:hypothetical protein [Alphaproteobacteria bacterium]
MTVPPLDPFSQSFDSIEVDPDRAPAREAIESAMSYLGPRETVKTQEPGFYLLDDANGRFVIDREMGVVTLADNSILQSERNAVHGVRLRVVEPSGATYELEMRLRISGSVPQMIGAEEFAAIAGLTDETILVAPRVPVLIVPQEEPKAPVEITPAHWTRFAVSQGHQSRTPRQQPRRGFIIGDTPQTNEDISLAFDGLPRPFSAHLPWSL